MGHNVHTEGIVDLHTHSIASDGSMRPAELVRHAKNSGLSAIALTDHDTTEGLTEALHEGEKENFEVIPGIEISADFRPEMHILGYFAGNKYLNIENLLKVLKINREERNPRIVNRLNELGFDISMDEVKEEVPGNIVGRLHIAKALMKKKYVRSMDEAFEKYLSSGKPAYFKKDKLTPEECIREIHKAGGIPVLAHPLYLNLGLHQLDGLLADLKRCGLKGIEAYYTENTGDDTGNFLRLAIKHDLLVTGGSDFHGDFRPGVEIGVGRGNLNIPYKLLDNLKKLLYERIC